MHCDLYDSYICHISKQHICLYVIYIINICFIWFSNMCSMYEPHSATYMKIIWTYMSIYVHLYKLNIREIYEMFHFCFIFFIRHTCIHIWPYINIILTYMCTYMCTYMFTHMRTYMSTYMFRHICSLSKIYGHYMSLAYMLHICLFRMG